MTEKRTKSGSSAAVRNYHHSVNTLAGERVHLRRINEKLESMLPKRDASGEGDSEDSVPIDVFFDE